MSNSVRRMMNLGGGYNDILRRLVFTSKNLGGGGFNMPIRRVVFGTQDLPPGPALGQLRDICTTPMCDAGAASVAEMENVFAALDAAGKSHFQSSHDSIRAAFDQNDHFYSDLVPFNSACCTVQSIGVQAEQLMNQMQIFMGQAPSGPGPAAAAKPGDALSTIVTYAAIGLGAYVALQLVGVLRK